MKAFLYQWRAFFLKGNNCTKNGQHSERTQPFIPHDHGNAKNLEFRVKVQRLEEMSTSIHNVNKKVWRKLNHQRLVATILMMFKLYMGWSLNIYNLDSYLEMIRLCINWGNSENKLALPQPRINYLKRSFSYRDAMLWSNLSPEHYSFEWDTASLKSSFSDIIGFYSCNTVLIIR